MGTRCNINNVTTGSDNIDNNPNTVSDNGIYTTNNNHGRTRHINNNTIKKQQQHNVIDNTTNKRHNNNNTDNNGNIHMSGNHVNNTHTTRNQPT